MVHLWALPPPNARKVTQTTVSFSSILIDLPDRRFSTSLQSTPPPVFKCATVALPSMSQEWSIRQSFAMSTVPISDSMLVSQRHRAVAFQGFTHGSTRMLRCHCRSPRCPVVDMRTVSERRYPRSLLGIYHGYLSPALI